MAKKPRGIKITASGRGYGEVPFVNIKITKEGGNSGTKGQLIQGLPGSSRIFWVKTLKLQLSLSMKWKPTTGALAGKRLRSAGKAGYSICWLAQAEPRLVHGTGANG